MNRILKIILRTVGIMAIISVAIIFAVRSSRERTDGICNGLKVDILDKNKLAFVTEDDVKRYISEGYGMITGVSQANVDLDEIERVVRSGSAVKSCEAYLSYDGFLHLAITQREPAMRFQVREGGFYVDEMGNMFPLQENYTSRVPVVNGELPFYPPAGLKGSPEQDSGKEWLAGMIRLAEFLENNKYWSNAISQITVDKTGNITLAPCNSVERIIFGLPDDIEKKFARIEKYYKYISPAKREADEKPYKKVDVRFEGQIVCR